MKSRQRVNQPFADSRSQSDVRADLRRHVSTNNKTLPSFHQVKRNSDDARVIAEQVRLWSQIEVRMNRRQQPVLARHVVSGRRNGSYRRTSKHELSAAEPHKISQV